MALDMGQPHAQDERKQQGAHHVHEGRHVDGEVRSQRAVLQSFYRLQTGVGRQEEWEEGIAREEREESGKERRAVCQQRCNRQELPCAFAQLADGGGYQSHDDKRYREGEEIGKEGIESHEQAGEAFRHELPAGNSRQDGYHDLP